MVEKTVKREATTEEALTVREALEGYPRGVIKDLKKYQDSAFMLYTALGAKLSKSKRREVAGILGKTNLIDFI